MQPPFLCHNSFTETKLRRHLTILESEFKRAYRVKLRFWWDIENVSWKRIALHEEASTQQHHEGFDSHFDAELAGNLPSPVSERTLSQKSKQCECHVNKGVKHVIMKGSDDMLLLMGHMNLYWSCIIEHSRSYMKLAKLQDGYSWLQMSIHPPDRWRWRRHLARVSARQQTILVMASEINWNSKWHQPSECAGWPGHQLA